MPGEGSKYDVIANFWDFFVDFAISPKYYVTV